MPAISYPHPVIGHGDDVSDDLEVKLLSEQTAERLELSGEFKSKEPFLETLVARGQAKYCVCVTCGSTYYSRSFHFSSNRFHESIPIRALREKIEIEFTIRANAKNDKYRPNNLHSDYGDAVFEIEQGDIIAYGGSAKLLVVPETDPIRRPIASIMRVEKSEMKEGPFALDVGGDLIVVRLSREDYDEYQSVKIHFASFVHASLVLPALTQAIAELNRAHEEHDGKKWAQRLEVLADRRDIVLDDPLIAAQRLLSAPLHRGMSRLNRYVESNAGDTL